MRNLDKHAIKIYLLYLGCIGFLVQGCRTCKKEEWVTLTINGERKSICFTGSYKPGEFTPEDRYLIETLRKLERGEEIEINQPGPPNSYTPETPLYIAVYYNLMHGKDVDITRYLLLKGADPNYPIGRYSVPPVKLLAGDWCSSEVACELTVLLLSYGAKVGYNDTRDTQEIIPLKQIELLTPWVDYNTYMLQFVLDNEPVLKKEYLPK
jgi:hypothetical protein